MEGIDDDARQPPGVENPFLEVEVPRSGLFGHEAPLQAVGEARHQTLQAGELLVHLGAQAGQLVPLAKRFGVHHLVELRGVGAVEGTLGSAVIGPRVASLGTARGILVALAGHELLFRFAVAGVLAVLEFSFAFFGGKRAFGFLFAALGAVVLGLFLVLLAVVIAVVVVVDGLGVVGQLQVIDQFGHRPGKRFLIVHALVEMRDLGADVFGDPVPP